ncbi:pyridoxal-phosphate dependent enzyme [Gimesia sp.]|uniref:pyridoxal-phosphate dependent enzyme n=1 Tax=Gimesia sp. TaxID=2024833 RepID=UPI000C3D1A08|nr:pyridoxal-phosphate dependent enzyme [Gimesia sp.]MAX37394.1 threonine synthase [Gimesia sp.]HBL43415.1 threonine synthase [Planctomycetaceae bacterium]|tara:strand:+ start:4760 stop:5812 length:1053 start_codon:yes stop_codon:yes gene_type:complete
MESANFTLGEGHTPLIKSRRIGPDAGLAHLYFKLETVNPTGSYKDRFAAAALTDMLHQGKKRVVTCSSGNAGSALAAYCAAAGMTCQVAVFIGAPENKLKQMLAYGATVWRIEGFGADPEISGKVFKYLKHLGAAPDTELQVSSYQFNPIGMAGVEFIGRELVEQISAEQGAVDHLFCCAGGGGLLLAVYRGFQTAFHEAKIERLPAFHCVQPTGNNTIAGPLQEGCDRAQTCQSTTKIGGLQVASVLDGNEVIAACRETGGSGYLVEDDFVYEVQALLARQEGIFCEPAAAVSLAGVLQAAAAGKIQSEETVVCVITGSGFKDQGSIDRMLADTACPVISLSEFIEQTA